MSADPSFGEPDEPPVADPDEPAVADPEDPPEGDPDEPSDSVGEPPDALELPGGSEEELHAMVEAPKQAIAATRSVQLERRPSSLVSGSHAGWAVRTVLCTCRCLLSRRETSRGNLLMVAASEAKAVTTKFLVPDRMAHQLR
jgi:hypothetical protein